MYKISLNKSLWPFISFIVTIALSVLAQKFNLVIISLPVWMLIGFTALFLIASISLYSKGTMKHYLAICATMLVLLTVSEIIIIGILSSMGINVLENIMLKISLVALALPIIMSIAITRLALIVDEVPHKKSPEIETEPLQVEEKTDTKEDVKEEVQHEETQKEEVKKEAHVSPTDTANVDTKTVEAPAEETQKPLFNKTKYSNEQTEEIFFEDIMDKNTKETATPALNQQEQTITESEPEVFFEDIIEDKQSFATQPKVDAEEPGSVISNVKEEQITDKIIEKPLPYKTHKPEPAEELEQIDLSIKQEETLGELPSLDGEIEELPDVKTKEQNEIIQKTPQLADTKELLTNNEEIMIEIQEEKDQEIIEEIMEEDLGPAFMPKLSESTRKIEDETGGKISSIGKLLVDKRDLENIIETHALMQHVGSDITAAKIISPIEGGKMAEKLNTIKELGASNLIVANECGFLQASTLEDKAKEQVLGAMTAGTMGIVLNSVRKMGFKTVKDITFESETGWLSLNKFKSNVYAIFFPSESSLYNLTEINEVLVTAAEREPEDLIDAISSINGVLGCILSDNNSELLASKLIDNAKNPENIAKILSAFYNNLGVFIKNMEQGSLRKCIIGTGNECIIFTSIGNNTLMLYAGMNTCIHLKDTKIQYETIISS